MEKPESLYFFDLHNHPFNKGAVSKTQEENRSWDPVEVKFKAAFPGNCWPLCIKDEYQIKGKEIIESQVKSGEISEDNFILMATQIFNSQSSLNDLYKSCTLSVSSLIAMEQAYAETWFIRCILPAVSPLDKKIVRAVIKKHITYNSLFNSELTQIAKTNEIKYFNILKSINDFKENEFNTILCIEGAHNLVGDHEHPEFIPTNLKKVKENSLYKFFYLTLTHLTRQPTAVHCIGTYIRIKLKKKYASENDSGNESDNFSDNASDNGSDDCRDDGSLNLTPNFKFQPDPCLVGLSTIGEKTIHEAYNPKPYRMLIDIKHMSYVSRLMFYKMRDNNEEYKKIPILATHMGVTGHSFEDAKYTSIELDMKDYKKRKTCDRVCWVPSYNPYLLTRFNPWTINLFDNDILKILESGGLIGLNLDQRILGVGKFPKEYMSPEEVKWLDLKNRPTGIDDSVSKGSKKFEGFYNPLVPISIDPNFQLTKDEMNAEKEYMIKFNPRHIDYLANNIVHILKVGFKAGYGTYPFGQMNVCDAISIGSDFDGMTDPINFPKVEKGDEIDPKNWVTAGKFEQLRGELEYSLNNFLEHDKELKQFENIICKNLIEKVCVLNGWEFLNKHFK